jgi:hypothetical protein
VIEVKDGKELIEENIKDVVVSDFREGNCKCIKCGAEANTKCPHCRTIFPCNQQEAMVSYGFKRHIKPDEHGVHWLEVSFYVGEGTKKNDLEWALGQLYKTLKAMADPDSSYPSIAEYACDHQFQFKKGEKSSISCGHSWRMYNRRK